MGAFFDGLRTNPRGRRRAARMLGALLAVLAVVVVVVWRLVLA